MVTAPASLEALFRPRSIAVIGASRTAGKNGNAVVRNLVRAGYGGRIFPVNPAGGAIEGIACYRALAALPETADCAMVVIPAADAVEAVRRCAAAGIRAVVVGASGFAEDGTEAGAARQAALAAIARQYGLALLGPNTNGFLNAADRVSLGYNAEHAEHFPPGGVSVVSHSGALFGGFARTLRRLGGGLCKFIPVGNEAGITMLDVLEYLIADEATGIIALVVEALDDGARLRGLAARARAAAKPIVALKIGRSAVGAEATLAHSSRLAGRARAYDALFAACGIASVGSVEALAGGCAVLASRGRPGDAGAQGLVCVTTSGAGGALLADAAAQCGLKLAGDGSGEWQGAAGTAIRALPARGRLRNPVDTGSLGRGWSQMGDIFALLEEAGITGPTVAYAHIAPQPEMDQALAAVLIERKRRTGAPVAVMAPGGLGADIEARYGEALIPVFHDLATGFDSLRCHFATLPPHASPPLPAGKREGPARRVGEGKENDRDWGEIARILRAEGARSRILSELASAQVLRRAGVAVVESHAFATLAEGEDIARRLLYPVVLKALAPGVAHKSEHGLVATAIRDAADLRRRFAAMADLPAARDAGFILQPMRQGALELIIGVSREPALGHFLVAGWGGIHAEALDQVSLLPIPATQAALAAWIAASPLARPLARFAAAPALMAALSALQGLVVACGDLIDSIDVNPFLVAADGCIAVDALVVTRGS